MSALSRPLAWFVAAVTLAGLAVAAAAGFAWQDEDGVILLALAGLAVVSELVDFAPFPNARVSLSVALILAAGSVSGLPGVAVVASAAVGADYLAHRKPLYKAAFNEGTLLVAGAAYVGVFDAFSTGYRVGDWPGVLGPALVGGALNYAINSGLVAMAIGLEVGRNPVSVWRDKFRWLLPYYVILGVLAVMLASAYERWDLAGVAILLVPLAMAWLAIKQYSDRATESGPGFQGAKL